MRVTATTNLPRVVVKSTRYVAGAFAVARDGSRSGAAAAGDGEAAGDAAGDPEGAGAGTALAIGEGDGEGAGAGDEQADNAAASATAARPREKVEVIGSMVKTYLRRRPGRYPAAWPRPGWPCSRSRRS